MLELFYFLTETPSLVERENQKSEKAVIDSSNFVEDEVSTIEYGLTAEDNLSKGTLALYFRDNNNEANPTDAIKYFSKAIELDSFIERSVELRVVLKA